MKNKAPRVGAVVLHNGSILLMHRIKNKHEYYAFPGGTVEHGEKIEDALMRELFEETSIDVEVVRLLYHLTVIDNANIKEEYFFLCNYVSGAPQLRPDSIEVERMSSGNEFYEPLWIESNIIEKLRIYPPEIKKLLIEDLRAGFSGHVKKIVAN